MKKILMLVAPLILGACLRTPAAAKGGLTPEEVAADMARLESALDPERRFLIAEGLGNTSHRDHLPRLRALFLAEPHPRARLGMALALGDMGDRAGVSRLLTAVENREYGSGEDWTRSLGRLVMSLATSADPRATDLLTRLFWTPPPEITDGENVRLSAADGLAHIGTEDSLSPLEGALLEGRKADRILAAQSLVRANAKAEVRKLLWEALRGDPEREVRAAAAESLRGGADDAVYRDLLELLASPAETPFTKHAILDAVERDGMLHWHLDILRRAARRERDDGVRRRLWKLIKLRQELDAAGIPAWETRAAPEADRLGDLAAGKAHW